MSGIKVVFLGESGVGKSSLITRYINNKFDESIMASVTANYVAKRIQYKGQTYTFDIWDTSGRQDFRPLTKIFLKDVKIIVLVYDITVKRTFLDLQYWLDFILENYPDALLILVGNRSDKSIDRAIKKSDGEKFAEVIHAEFAEISAKDDYGWNDFLDNVFINYLKMRGEGNKNDDDDDFVDDDDILI